MDTAQWPQGIGVVKSGVPEKKPRPQKEQAVNCPRCNSTNTKFCYYNNYSLSQPRYFCKTCRRYWTDGGSLRNVPVGGGSRKNRRSSSSSSSSPSSASKKLFSDPTPQNPNKIHEGQDLNLAYNPCNGMSEFVALPYCNNPPTLNPSPHLPVMELFKTGGFSSLMSDSNSVYSAGFSAMTEFKPSLGFGLDNYGSINQDHANPARVSFPFEELKVPVSNNGDDHHHQFVEERETGETNGYWNGMLSGGTW